MQGKGQNQELPLITNARDITPECKEANTEGCESGEVVVAYE